MRLLQFISFKLDPRSLALFRILIGIDLILDLMLRLSNLTEFYSDQGLLPRSLLLGKILHPWMISPLSSIGQPILVFLFMLTALLSFLAFTFGFKTKLAQFLSWFFFISFSARNPAVNHGGDDLLRLGLFFSMFLNLSACWAIHPEPQRRHTPLAEFGFTLQLMLMYFCTGLQKWHPIWHTDGTAIYYALNLDAFTTKIGSYMKDLFIITKPLTFIVLWSELLLPPIFLVLNNFYLIRFIIIALFCVFHLGLAMTLELGHFPYTAIIYWLALLPSTFWDFLLTKLNTTAKQNYLKLSALCGTPEKRPLPLRAKLAATFLLFCIGLIGCWNVGVHSDKDRLVLAEPTVNIGYLLRLHQRWDMFAPFPKNADGWIVANATLLNGSHIDILSGRPVTFEKPANLADDMIDTLWRKYFTNITSIENKIHLPYFARWLCREWNRGRPSFQKAIFFNLWVVTEKTPEPGKSSTPVPPIKIWDQYCIEQD